jgi:hypothetical protein
MFCKVKACHEKALRSLLSDMLFNTETKKDKNMSLADIDFEGKNPRKIHYPN